MPAWQKEPARFTHFIFCCQEVVSCSPASICGIFLATIFALKCPEILIFLRPSRILLFNVEHRTYVTGKGSGGYFDMNLSIDSYSASFDYNRDGLLKLIDRLERLGYKPLVRKAAKEFANIFGGNADNLRTLAASDDSEERLYTGELNRRRLLTLEKHGYDWNIDGMRGLACVPDTDPVTPLSNVTEKACACTDFSVNESTMACAFFKILSCEVLVRSFE